MLATGPSRPRRDLRRRRRGGRGRASRRSSSPTPSSRRSASAPTDQDALAAARRADRARVHHALHGQVHVGRDLRRDARRRRARTSGARDLGQVFNPPVEDGLAIMADRFLEAGFSEEEVRIDGGREHAEAGRCLSACR